MAQPKEGGGTFPPPRRRRSLVSNPIIIFILMKFSSKQVGGTSIEDIAEADPTAIIKVPVDIMKVIFSSITSTFKTFFHQNLSLKHQNLMEISSKFNRRNCNRAWARTRRLIWLPRWVGAGMRRLRLRIASWVQNSANFDENSLNLAQNLPKTAFGIGNRAQPQSSEKCRPPPSAAPLWS